MQKNLHARRAGLFGPDSDLICHEGINIYIHLLLQVFSSDRIILNNGTKYLHGLGDVEVPVCQPRTQHAGPLLSNPMETKHGLRRRASMRHDS